MIYVYTVYFILFTLVALSIYFVYGTYQARKATVKLKTKKYLRSMRRIKKGR